MADIYRIRGVRGATTAAENTPEAIGEASLELLQELIKANSINNQDIASVIFTMTTDLYAEFPAKVARIELGWDEIPMICTQEIPVPDSIQKCIRVLIHLNTLLNQDEIKHIYLGNAVNLRPDLAEKRC